MKPTAVQTNLSVSDCSNPLKRQLWYSVFCRFPLSHEGSVRAVVGSLKGKLRYCDFCTAFANIKFAMDTDFFTGVCYNVI